MDLDLLYIRPSGTGWGPVDALAHLATRLLGARLIQVPEREAASILQRAAGLLPRLPSRSSRKLLVLAPNPSHLALAARLRFWAPGYATTAAWVIDSFWTERVARFARSGRHFDHLFITDPGLVDEWSRLTDAQVSVLPWGADTLSFPVLDGDRPTDLLRVGRQPPAWDDDERTAALAARHGLCIEGRPPLYADDPARSYGELKSALQRTRCVLAFSNLVSPAAYTHPTRDYLTGRWTDALAAGALVVGTAPASAADVLWEGATAEISPVDPEKGLDHVVTLCAEWSPQEARERQLQARLHLDWRHRLLEISRALELPVSPALTTELMELEVSR